MFKLTFSEMFKLTCNKISEGAGVQVHSQIGGSIWRKVSRRNRLKGGFDFNGNVSGATIRYRGWSFCLAIFLFHKGDGKPYLFTSG